MAFRFFVAIACAVSVAGWPMVAADAAPANLYVAKAGSDSNACTTQAEPCHTIDHAISLAGASGTTIHVAAGTYGTVTPGSKNVTIVGVGANLTTGTVIDDIGAAVVVDNSSA